MRRNTFRPSTTAALAIGALVLAGGLLTAGSSVTGAAAASVSASQVDRFVVPESQKAGDYWTASRMMAAQPLDLSSTVEAPGAAHDSGPIMTGPERLVQKQVALDAPTLPIGSQPKVITNIGKIFFSMGTSDYVCSGNAVSSGNQNTVSTAGHCVNEGPGPYMTNWSFVPGYNWGDAPYGKWEAEELLPPIQWTTRGDLNYDTGFAVVTPPAGTSLSATVGATGVAFNVDRGLAYTAYGYPAEPPFTGETQQRCADTAMDDTFGTSDSQHIECNMTGGSSGGPWIVDGTGLQNSINSFGYIVVPNQMYGPYWGSVIESVYVAAAA